MMGKTNELLISAIEKNDLSTLLDTLKSRESNFNINAVVDLQGCPLIILAALKGNAEIVQTLLNAGADINAKDSAGRTGIHYAALKGYVEVTETFIQYGGVDKIHGALALISALATSKNVKIAELLINAGFMEPSMILHAAKLNDSHIVQLILDKYPYIINYQIFNGWNALMISADEGNFEILKILVNHGANLFYENEEGKTALDLAIQNDHKEIINFFKKTLDKQALGFKIQYYLMKTKAIIHNKFQRILYQQGLLSTSLYIVIHISYFCLHYFRVLIQKIGNKLKSKI